MKLTRIALAFAVLGSITVACGGDDSDDDDAAAGKGGSAGSGTAGKGGSSGKGGSAGKGGTSGASGEGAASGASGEGAAAGESGNGGASGGTGGTAGSGTAGSATGNAGATGDVFGDPNPVPAGGFWNCVDPSAGGGGGVGSADSCSCVYAGAVDTNAARTCTGTSPCCILSRAVGTGVYTCACSDDTDAECDAKFEALKVSATYVHAVDSCPTYP